MSISLSVSSSDQTIKTYQMSKVPLREETDEDGKGAEGDQNLVSTVVVGRIIFAVNLRRNDRSNLNNNIIGGDLHRSAFD